MKCRIWICALFAISYFAASAQVASHAPTAVAKATQPLTSASAAPAKLSDRPVAKVNGAVLTDRDLLREMYAIFPYAQQHNGGFPKAQEAAIRQGALDMIIFEELLYQEAVRRKVVIPPQKVKQGEAEFKKQFASSEGYEQFLKIEMQGRPELLRQKICRSMMIEQILKTEVEDKSAVTLAEARAYYEKNPQRFTEQESYNIQTISILPPKDADPTKLTPQQKADVRKRADEALRQSSAAKGYEQFGTLAEKISDDDYRVVMGLHKQLKPEDLPPDMRKQLASMQPGAVSGLIPVLGAFTIVRLDSHTPAKKKSFEQVKASLRAELQKNKYESLRANLDKKLREKAKIEKV